jgi:hypothetical protein
MPVGMSQDLPPPHPPHQAKKPPKPRPAPHKRHKQLMRRPNEPLHLARHALQPHPAQPTKETP